ncbi:unnamed protein product [Clavelina lepadiformis]|uniref:Endonuclease/exonuclease/phosphatase domain-containing protein n=1 Tax=Clavelina lepadiformis TaxID=159417 RepID=A0ABP0GE61_CLALP
MPGGGLEENRSYRQSRAETRTKLGYVNPCPLIIGGDFNMVDDDPERDCSLPTKSENVIDSFGSCHPFRRIFRGVILKPMTMWSICVTNGWNVKKPLMHTAYGYVKNTRKIQDIKMSLKLQPTYRLQGKIILEKKSSSQTKGEWPFLLHEEHLLNHYNTLMEGEAIDSHELLDAITNRSSFSCKWVTQHCYVHVI